MNSDLKGEEMKIVIMGLISLIIGLMFIFLFSWKLALGIFFLLLGYGFLEGIEEDKKGSDLL